MQPLNCDKPYNLDEAAARRGAPRRRRKDSRTTAYELTIRIPEEHRRHFGGKKKLTRVVFALNKKVDLRGQVKAFEEEKNAALALALEREGGGGLDAAAWAAMPFGEYAERYVDRRAGAISAATVANERRYLEYAKATIGAIPLKELVAEDVERCVLAVPRLSREWAEEKRRALDEMGLVLRSSTPLLGEAGNPWGYNSFKKRWNAFVRKAGFAGTRPYALRHTFATINLARGENIKTVSVLLGHADASYTLDLYVGFIPATTRGLANRYVGRLAPGLAGAGGGCGEE